MKGLKIIGLVFMMALMVSARGWADDTEAVTASATVGAIQALAVDSASVSMGTVDATILDAGEIEKTSGTTCTVDSNAAYVLNVKATGSDLGGGKAYTDFLWKEQAAGSYAAITTSDVEVASDDAGSDDSIIVDYKMSLDWTDAAATYSAAMLYTLTTS